LEIVYRVQLGHSITKGTEFCVGIHLCCYNQGVW